MRRALWRYPAMTFGVIARIHLQAVRLWFKRTPFFRQPEPPRDFVHHGDSRSLEHSPHAHDFSASPSHDPQHATPRPPPAPPPALTCRAMRPPPRAPCCSCCNACATAASRCNCPTARCSASAASRGPTASLRLHNWNVCTAALKSGDIGFAESYIAGDWHSPDLTALLRLFIANRRDIEDMVYGSWLGRLAYRVRHLLNRNSKTNSRKNIHAHYDLGNAFYELWLDGTMNYSSALFETPEQDMVSAQNAKVRRALQMAGVKPGDRVLEIGCGWGALAEMAHHRIRCLDHRRDAVHRTAGVCAQRMARTWERPQTRSICACRTTATSTTALTTPSAPSKWWRRWAANTGRPTSRRWPRLLKPGGQACVQSIVIDDALFERYIKSTDFIQQYIFPGGCLPSPRAFREAGRARRAGGGGQLRLRAGLRAHAAALARRLSAPAGARVAARL